MRKQASAEYGCSQTSAHARPLGSAIMPHPCGGSPPPPDPERPSAWAGMPGSAPSPRPPPAFGEACTQGSGMGRLLASKGPSQHSSPRGPAPNTAHLTLLRLPSVPDSTCLMPGCSPIPSPWPHPSGQVEVLPQPAMAKPVEQCVGDCFSPVSLRGGDLRDRSEEAGSAGKRVPRGIPAHAG